MKEGEGEEEGETLSALCVERDTEHSTFSTGPGNKHVSYYYGPSKLNYTAIYLNQANIL